MPGCSAIYLFLLRLLVGYVHIHPTDYISLCHGPGLQTPPTGMEDVDRGSSTCSDRSPIPDAANTPACTRVGKKGVMFQALDPGQLVSAEKDTKSLLAPTLLCSLEGNSFAS